MKQKEKVAAIIAALKAQYPEPVSILKPQKLASTMAPTSWWQARPISRRKIKSPLQTPFTAQFECAVFLR